MVNLLTIFCNISGACFLLHMSLKFYVINGSVKRKNKKTKKNYQQIIVYIIHLFHSNIKFYSF